MTNKYLEKVAEWEKEASVSGAVKNFMGDQARRSPTMQAIRNVKARAVEAKQTAIRNQATRAAKKAEADRIIRRNMARQGARKAELKAVAAKIKARQNVDTSAAIKSKLGK